MQFQMVEQRAAGRQHRGILLRRQAAEIPRTNVAQALAQHLRLVLQAVALDQAQIDRDIATCGVLDEERDVGHLVEEPFEDGQVDCLRRPGYGRDGSCCAHFDAELKFSAKPAPAA